LGRILLLLIIVFLLWLIFRGFLRSQTKKTEVPAKTPIGEDMVACARCGVNLPRSEARLESGIYYCQDNPRCRSVA
jgi:uncharacterized protein